MARISVARPSPAIIDQLVALESRCFPPSDRFSRRVWRHLLGPAARRGTALTLAMHEEDRLVAAIVGLYRTSSKTVRIYSIAVDPAERGRGLAVNLIAALLKRSRGCARVSLEVRLHGAARRFYDRIGMRATRKLPGYYGDSDGIRFEADLGKLLSSVGKR